VILVTGAAVNAVAGDVVLYGCQAYSHEPTGALPAPD